MWSSSKITQHAQYASSRVPSWASSSRTYSLATSVSRSSQPMASALHGLVNDKCWRPATLSRDSSASARRTLVRTSANIRPTSLPGQFHVRAPHVKGPEHMRSYLCHLTTRSQARGTGGDGFSHVCDVVCTPSKEVGVLLRAATDQRGALAEGTPRQYTGRDHLGIPLRVHRGPVE